MDNMSLINIQNDEGFTEKLLIWYEEKARDLPWRKNTDPYRVWLSEIMLQQTQVETVIDYFNRFLNAFPTIEALAHADEEKVMKLWEGLGYYSRARNLHKTAKIIGTQYGGIFPNTKEALLKLPGIGAYTAGAILSISFNQPVAAVDGNVLRVISRVTEDYRCIDQESIKREMAKHLEAIYPENRCGDFTQSLMELGATVCLPKGTPLCHQCPVMTVCRAYKSDTYSALPVRKEKKSRRLRQLTIFVYRCQGRIALQKRTEKGVLEGMWQLPNIDGNMDSKAVLAHLKEQGNLGARIESFKEANHIFTHIQWQMVCYYISCENTFGDYIWVDSKEMEREYAIPTAFKKFLGWRDMP